MCPKSFLEPMYHYQVGFSRAQYNWASDSLLTKWEYLHARSKGGGPSRDLLPLIQLEPSGKLKGKIGALWCYSRPKTLKISSHLSVQKKEPKIPLFAEKIRF